MARTGGPVNSQADEVRGSATEVAAARLAVVAHLGLPVTLGKGLVAALTVASATAYLGQRPDHTGR